MVTNPGHAAGGIRSAWPALRLLAAVGAAVLALPGCGDDASRGGGAPVRVDFREAAPPKPAGGSEDPPLRVAVAAMISPKYTYQYYVDFVNLLAARTGRRAELVQRKTYAEVNDLLERSELDLAFVCSGPYVLGHRKFGLQMIGVPVVRGESVYYSYLIARPESPVRSLEDLRGKVFAFTDPDSNTGYLVPNAMLQRRGERPETYFRKTFFTHSHDNSVKAVADGLADGAAVDSLIYRFLEGVQPELTRRTRVVETSEPFGIPPVVVPKGLDPALKKALRSALLALHQDPEGAAVLRELGIERFAPGDDRAYESVRAQLECLEGRGR